MFGVGSVAAAPPSATPVQAIDFLNAQRAANGIPAGIVENPAWSEGCRLHNNYMRFNDLLEHDEDPAKPAYSAEGDAAGMGSVLSRTGSFGTGTNPWEQAPMHLMQLLGPRLSVTGVNDSDGYACMRTWAGYQRAPAAADTLYSYPGDSAEGVPPSQVAFEEPFVPGDFVGLAQGTVTGPHLFLLADGPWVATSRIVGVESATLTGPAGPVEIRSVTNATPDIGALLPPGAIVIPAKPLLPGTLYQAQVTLRSTAGVQLARSWSFRTGRVPNGLQLYSATVSGDRVEVIARSDAANATVRVEGAAIRGGRDPIEVDGGRITWSVTVSKMPTRVCVTSGGGSDTHELVERCVEPEGVFVVQPKESASRPGGGSGSCKVKPVRTGAKVRLVATGCGKGLVLERKVGKRWTKIRGPIALSKGARPAWRARVGARVVARGVLPRR
jgi:hypothetical protein